ncbi:MAG: hypothetical protein ACTH6N_07440 [Brachybacterium tyrofermentans]|uniref:hypothetical protein n=1 Tax=Brachybacterium tyrofermentans TaxID=47848 RepID=UPI001866060E|nr:hypothetical protein [Brachybacterium tyrofermentans]
MTTSTGALPTPRRVPRAVHVAEAILYGAMAALLFEVLPLPIIARLLLLLVLLALFGTLGITAQIRCWGAFIAPAFTPARVASSVFIAVSCLLATWLPHDAPFAGRAAVTVALPLAYYLLMRWDDARTVVLLRSREEAHRARGAHPAAGTRSPV